MPDHRFLVMSGLCVASGVMMILFPNAMLWLSTSLNRAFAVDLHVARHRYLVGLMLFAVGYFAFRLAILLPTLDS